MGCFIFLRLIIVYVSLAFVHLIASDQGKIQTPISGIVLNKNSDRPISNVNIFIANDKNIGTISDGNGKYYIEGVFELPVILEFSHIGYKIKQVVVNKSNIKNLIIFLEETSVRMPELTVTAMRNSKNYDDIPISTNVITKEDIEGSGMSNLNELFYMLPGFSFERSVGPSPALQLSGMDIRSVLVLFDGQPLIGKFNNRVSLDQIQLNQIERVEIIKGPSSSLHGSEAMAGVINIISRKYTDSKKINFGMKYQNTSSNIIENSFEDSFSSINMNYFLKNKKIDFLISIQSDNINDFDPLNLFEIDNISKKNIGTRFNWRGTGSNFFSIKTNNFIQNDKGSSKIINVNTDIGRQSISVNQHYYNFNHSLIINNYRRSYLKEKTSGKIEMDEVSRESAIEYEIIYNSNIMNGELTSGYEIRKLKYQSDRIDNQSQDIINQSVFAQFDRSFIRNYKAIFGLRIDDYSEFETVINPRIGIMKNYEKIKIRMSWGKGFRSPSFLERFIDWNHAQYNYTVKGNSNLKPEISEGITIGADIDFNKKHQTAIFGHFTKYDNLIESVSLSSGVLSYSNLRNAMNYSFEINQKWVANKTTKLGVSLIYSKRFNQNDTVLPNTNPLSASVTLNHDLGGFQLIFYSKWFASFKLYEFNSDTEKYIFTNENSNSHIISNIVVKKIISTGALMKFGISNIEDQTNERFGPYIGRFGFVELQTSF